MFEAIDILQFQLSFQFLIGVDRKAGSSNGNPASWLNYFFQIVSNNLCGIIKNLHQVLVSSK